MEKTPGTGAQADAEGVRPLDELRSQAVGTFDSLPDAQRSADAFVVLHGDEGAQIHALFPASYVRCSEERLERLLIHLDGIASPENVDYDYEWMRGASTSS
jgi:hypothetical protein